jgi:hypothetical protein
MAESHSTDGVGLAAGIESFALTSTPTEGTCRQKVAMTHIIDL